MLLAYLDESYCKDCYYVAALVCPERQLLQLTAALNEVVASAAENYGIAPTAELHGYDIFQARGEWTSMAAMVRARIGIYHRTFAAIVAHQVHVIIRGVRSQELRERYGNNAGHPHSIALAHLLERIDEFAERAGELALVIADEPGQDDQQPEYRGDLERYRQDGTSGYRSRRLTQIVDTIHFTPSSASRLLQAIDMIAFLYHRIQTTGPGADQRASRANQALWNRINPLVVHSHCWSPKPKRTRAPL